MKTYNFSKKHLSVETKMALDRWAKHLEADEMTIHEDGTITLISNRGGYICHNYTPRANELYKKEDK